MFAKIDPASAVGGADYALPCRGLAATVPSRGRVSFAERRNKCVLTRTQWCRRRRYFGARENGDDTYTRVSRAWHSSLNQLKKPQTARASHLCELFQTGDRDIAGQCPLAGLAKLPKPLLLDAISTQGVQ